jgi:hypothetical protein
MIVVDDNSGEILGEVAMTRRGEAVVVADGKVTATAKEGLTPNAGVCPDKTVTCRLHSGSTMEANVVASGGVVAAGCNTSRKYWPDGD